MYLISLYVGIEPTNIIICLTNIAIWEAYGCNLSNWTRLISHTTFTIHNAPAQIFVRFDTLNDNVECGRDVLHRTWKKIKYILRTLTEQQSSKFCNFWAISRGVVTGVAGVAVATPIFLEHSKF